MMLQSLSILGPGQFHPDPMQFSFVEGLTPLTRVQHLHLTQCVPLKQFFWIAMVICSCSSFAMPPAV